MDSITSHDRVTTLLKREAERQLDLQKKRNDKKIITPENEQYNYFTEIFQDKLKDIELWLANAPNTDKKEIAFHFDKISREIHSLQKFVADSLIFLRDYDIRVCQESLQEIETKARKLEEQLIPKKKFGFKNKRSVKNIDLAPKQNGHDVADNIKKNAKFSDLFYGFRDQNNAFLSITEENLYKKDISLHNLEKCIIQLNGTASTLHISSLVNCVVLCGPISTSVFAENCKNCKFILACQQLRLHNSNDCDIYLHVTSRAIIEYCRNIRVAPYNHMYDTLNEDFKRAGLDQTVNHWNEIDDFNWLVVDKHSPNWSLLEDACKIKN